MIDSNLLLFFVVILVAFVFGEIFYRFNLPRSIGQILAGLVLGLPFYSGFFSLENNPMILLLSELGIIFLLILTGLEIDLKRIRECSKDVLLIAVFSVLIPFVLGFVFVFVVWKSLIFAFIVGAALSVTSEATKSIVLMQKNVLQTKLGETMVLAGAVDDIFELLFLSVLLVFVGENSGQNLVFFPFEVIGFFVAVFIALKLLPRIIGLFKQDSDDGYFTLALLVALGLAFLSSMLSLGTIIGALIAGLLLQKAIKSEQTEHAIENHLRVLTFALVIPFFHLHIGLMFDAGSIVLYPFVMLAILFIAFAGKMAGALIVKPFSSLELKQLMLVGWGMNSRGFMELVMLAVVMKQAIGFPVELYSAIVFMTIVTTIAFPLALNYYLKKYPYIMH
ncbi:MAG: cation:proton antiporter [archaeon]